MVAIGWVMDWVIAQHGAQLNIQTTGIIVDACTPLLTRDIKCEMVLDVDLNNGQQTWQRTWRNPNRPNPDTCDGTRHGPNTITGTTANIQVAVMANDVVEVDLEFTVWDCNQNPPVSSDASVSGTIDVF